MRVLLQSQFQFQVAFKIARQGSRYVTVMGQNVLSVYLRTYLQDGTKDVEGVSHERLNTSKD